jgi:VIT1/CCC1 family predicted Fe2+/Mn2+ transporter
MPEIDIRYLEHGNSKIMADLEKVGSLRTASDTISTSVTPSIKSMDSEFPEGGLEAWLVVFGSFCSMMSAFGLINTAAVFESWFATHQLTEYSASQIGWIFSLYLFFVFFIGIQVGPVFDAYGPRYLVATGSILTVASLMLLGFCRGSYPGQDLTSQM